MDKARTPRLGQNARTVLNTLEARGPMTATALLDVIRPVGKSKGWGRSFFLLGKGNGRGASLLLRGFICRYGVARGGAWLYDLTEKGLSFTDHDQL